MKVMFFAPHPDDVEVGCGGILKKLKELQVEMVIVCNTISDMLTDEEIENVRKEEQQKVATDINDILPL